MFFTKKPVAPRLPEKTADMINLAFKPKPAASVPMLLADEVALRIDTLQNDRQALQDQRDDTVRRLEELEFALDSVTMMVDTYVTLLKNLEEKFGKDVDPRILVPPSPDDDIFKVEEIAEKFAAGQ